MEEIIVSCVESRKNALLGVIDQNDASMMDTVNTFFKKVEEFAKDCSDVNDFETKFQSSPLAKEYADLFAMSIGGETPEEPSLKDEIKDELVDDAKHAVRRKARQDAYDKVRDIPGVGDALSVKQHFDFFSRFRKKGD